MDPIVRNQRHSVNGYRASMLGLGPKATVALYGFGTGCLWLAAALFPNNRNQSNFVVAAYCVAGLATVMCSGRFIVRVFIFNQLQVTPNSIVFRGGRSDLVERLQDLKSITKPNWVLSGQAWLFFGNWAVFDFGESHPVRLAIGGDKRWLPTLQALQARVPHVALDPMWGLALPLRRPLDNSESYVAGDIRLADTPRPPRPLKVRLAGCLIFVAIGVAMVLWPTAIASPRNPASGQAILGWASIVFFCYAFVSQAMRARGRLGLLEGSASPGARPPASSLSRSQDFDASSSAADAIRSKTFALAVRGYSVDDVDEWLERAATLTDDPVGGARTSPLADPAFRKSIRGYDVPAVDAFVADVRRSLQGR